jgi:hypothetical protein
MNSEEIKVSVSEQNFEKLQQLIQERESKGGQIISLNIGGKHFKTLQSTLNKSKFFQDLFSNNEDIIYDKNDCIFLDRPPKEFSLILDGLRTGIIETPVELKDFKNLISEIQFYKLEKQFSELCTKCTFFGSTITNTSQQKQLNAWVNNYTKDWNLLYKASKDGFSASSFYKKCNSKSNTLTIMYFPLFF